MIDSFGVASMHALVEKLKAPLRGVRRAYRIRNDLHSGRESMLASKVLTNSEKELLRRISLRLHRNDDMYTWATASFI
jgi:hypothetical protein